jgi:hypothetical protein
MSFIAYIRNAFGKKEGFRASQTMSFVRVSIYTALLLAFLACVQVFFMYSFVARTITEDIPRMATQFPLDATLSISDNRLNVEGNASSTALTMTLPHVTLHADDTISFSTFTPRTLPGNHIEWISDAIVFVQDGAIVETIFYPQGTFIITKESITVLSVSLQKNILWLVAFVGVFIYIAYCINLLFFLVCVNVYIRICSYFSDTKKGYAYATRVALYMSVSYSTVMLIGSIFGISSFVVSVLVACLCVWYATR